MKGREEGREVRKVGKNIDKSYLERKCCLLVLVLTLLLVTSLLVTPVRKKVLNIINIIAIRRNPISEFLSYCFIDLFVL